MRELMLSEIECISGGGKEAEVESGTLAKPFRGDSEKGKWGNDIAGALNALGGWIGRSIWDMTHKK